MGEFSAHQAVTATEPGHVGGQVYQLYPQVGSQTDYFLYSLSGNTSNISVQGTDVAAQAALTPPPPATSSASITDVNGTAWSIIGGVVAVNGVAGTDSSGVTQLAYINNVMWQFNGSNWWYKVLPTDTWLPSGGTSVSPITTTMAQTITGLTAGSTYDFQVLAYNASGNGPASSPAVVVTTPTAASGFSISGGRLLGPSGSLFRPKGINMGDSDIAGAVTNAACQPLLTLFPGLNFIRLACYSYQPPSFYQQYVTWLSAKNIVLELENHQNYDASGNSLPGASGGGAGYIIVNFPAALATEQAWYSSIASAFKTNPYVWFGTNNEPPGPGSLAATGYPNQSLTDLSTWHKDTYNTIRGTGNNSIIMIDPWGGGVPGDGSMTLAGVAAGGSELAGAMTASVYAAMTGVLWDYHQYPWQYTGMSLSACQASQLSNITQLQQFTSRDGVIPIIGGECGQSSSGQSIDSPGEVVVQATIANSTGAKGALCGASFWEWNNGGAVGDQLTNNQGTALTSPYGTDVAAFCLTTP